MKRFNELVENVLNEGNKIIKTAISFYADEEDDPKKVRKDIIKKWNIDINTKRENNDGLYDASGTEEDFRKFFKDNEYDDFEEEYPEIFN